MGYTINTDYLSIITESASPLSPVYKEAAENAEKGTRKGLMQLKNFITSIENLAKKPGVKDNRISSSKGNIKEFSGYNDIKTAIEFLNKNLSSVADVKECVKVYDALEKWASLYEKGYSDGVRLIQLEYENAVYMLVTNLSSIIATNVDIVANGMEIKIVKKSATTHGVIQKTIKDLAKQLGDRNHKEYLEALLEASEKNINESVYTEGALEFVAASFALLKGLFNNAGNIISKGVYVLSTIKKSVFGIVPLIRCCMYIRYKKKADTIAALEEQMVFISRNIEQLKNIKTMDEVKKRMIIKKQEATIEAYRKKAEKLRAQLMETEKDAAVAIKKEDPQMKEDDGDLVLESGRTVEEVFNESAFGGYDTEFTESADYYPQPKTPAGKEELKLAEDKYGKGIFHKKIPEKLLRILTKVSMYIMDDDLQRGYPDQKLVVFDKVEAPLVGGNPETKKDFSEVTLAVCELNSWTGYRSKNNEILETFFAFPDRIMPVLFDALKTLYHYTKKQDDGGLTEILDLDKEDPKTMLEYWDRMKCEPNFIALCPDGKVKIVIFTEFDDEDGIVLTLEDGSVYSNTDDLKKYIGESIRR